MHMIFDEAYHILTKLMFLFQLVTTQPYAAGLPAAATRVALPAVAGQTYGAAAAAAAAGYVKCYKISEQK